MGKSAFSFFLIFLFPLSIFAFEVKANNIQYFFYKNEKLQWIFKAEKFFQKNSYEFFAEKVYITNPLKEFSIEGKKAMYNMQKDEFIIKGNVKLVTKDKGVLFTPKLVFFPNKQLIVGKDEVVLKRENIVIHGRGFFYDVKKGKFTITSQTRVEILN